MRHRKYYGTANITGRNIERLRKKQGISQKDFIARLQTSGLDIDPSSYSKLEGQLRTVTDAELMTIAKILKVDLNRLFE